MSLYFKILKKKHFASTKKYFLFINLYFFLPRERKYAEAEQVVVCHIFDSCLRSVKERKTSSSFYHRISLKNAEKSFK